jgi:vitamin B12 transporter
MTVPYGEATYGETSAGTNLRYKQPLGHGISVDAVGGYTYIRGDFVDLGSCVYDWFGRCVRERREPGETGDRPYDQLYWDHSGFGRANLSWQIRDQHALRLALAPTYFTRTGDERAQSDLEVRDPLTAERQLLTLVNGVEYEADLFDDRLENIFFVKQYVQLLKSEEPLAGDVYRRRDRDTHRFGIGNGLRYRFSDWLYAKASYEWATRLPNPEEVFGDNVFVRANLELEAETSHNFNLGYALDTPESEVGVFRSTANAFLREADQLIVLLGLDRNQSYQNVFGARSMGIEGAAGWTSAGEYVTLDGNVTYQDFRNTSAQGTFGEYKGDRIPNRPYLFANCSARLQFRGVVAAKDEISLSWNSRYVHEYFRGWESVGLVEFKAVTPAQFVHSAGLGYLIDNDTASISWNIEAQNLSNEQVYDFFGVQRPGRAFYAKMTVEL